MSKSGYVNGSDMLLYVNSKAIGHCTSHTTTYNSETKDRAVKPAATSGISSGMWKGKGVVGLSISISADGLRFYDESECGYKELLALWKAGASVTVKCAERVETTGGTAPSAYLEGNFVITSLEESNPAQDDASYKVSLENDGEPTTFAPSNLTGASAGGNE